jgi:hypothetical protein
VAVRVVEAADAGELTVAVGAEGLRWLDDLFFLALLELGSVIFLLLPLPRLIPSYSLSLTLSGGSEVSLPWTAVIAMMRIFRSFSFVAKITWMIAFSVLPSTAIHANNALVFAVDEAAEATKHTLIFPSHL